jgi:glycosyltransferase involved in cell wall biosynthesis
MVSPSTDDWTRDFAEYFIQCGDKVLVASFSPNCLKKVPMEYLGPKNPKTYSRGTKQYLYITRVPRLKKIISEFQPDVVYAIYFSSYALTASLAWKGPLAVSAIGSDVLDHVSSGNLKRKIKNIARKYVSKKADIINTVSSEITQKLIHLGTEKDKILEMPFGVDTNLFFPEKNKTKRDKIQLVCTRSHRPVYDIPTIIKALEELKQKYTEFHCTFTSKGFLLEKHKKMVRNLGLDSFVTFKEITEHSKMAELLKETDIYISASLSDGTSISLLEAMATGLFPVVSDINANEPWIEHGSTGFLFKTGDSCSLKAELEKAIINPELRQKAVDRNMLKVKEKSDKFKNLFKLRKRLQIISHD